MLKELVYFLTHDFDVVGWNPSVRTLRTDVGNARAGACGGGTDGNSCCAELGANYTDASVDATVGEVNNWRQQFDDPLD